MSSVQPIFFGKQDQPLFGIYHAPTGAPGDQAVLLCYPGPQEYLRSHWSFRRLATQLARQGFHVLRFDYFGTGDSAGECHQGLPIRWMDDIRLAAAELRDMAAVNHLCAVGLRLGAALLSQASSGLGLHSAVLWEPVINGNDYLAELRLYERYRNLLLLPPPRPGADELLGYPFSQEHAQFIGQLNLLQAPAMEARRVTIVAGHEHPQHQQLHEMLRSAGRETSHQVVPDQAASADCEGALVSSRVLSTITDALKQGA